MIFACPSLVIAIDGRLSQHSSIVRDSRRCLFHVTDPGLPSLPVFRDRLFFNTSTGTRFGIPISQTKLYFYRWIPAKFATAQYMFSSKRHASFSITNNIAVTRPHCLWSLCFLESLLWWVSSVAAKQRRRFPSLYNYIVSPFFAPDCHSKIKGPGKDKCQKKTGSKTSCP